MTAISYASFQITHWKCEMKQKTRKKWWSNNAKKALRCHREYLKWREKNAISAKGKSRPSEKNSHVNLKINFNVAYMWHIWFGNDVHDFWFSIVADFECIRVQFLDFLWVCSIEFSTGSHCNIEHKSLGFPEMLEFFFSCSFHSSDFSAFVEECVSVCANDIKANKNQIDHLIDAIPCAHNKHTQKQQNDKATLTIFWR